MTLCEIAPMRPKRGRTRRVDHARVKQLAADGLSPAGIASLVGCTPMYARQIAKGKTGDGCNQRLSRFAAPSLNGRSSRSMPPIDNPSVMEGRSLFSDHVISPSKDTLLLKSGHNSAKIGKTIAKGKWKGFEVYTLTLEERRTCPISCQHWRSCYGNNMHLAERFAHGEKLETQIVYEIAKLARRHPGGFCIRLHVLGDFYSVRYVQLWRILLDECRQLHVFGFSARWDCERDPIAKELVSLVKDKWDRFAIRFSNAPIDECSTVSIEHPFQVPADAVICPQQVGKTAACATCGFCWHSRRRVAFIQH